MKVLSFLFKWTNRMLTVTLIILLVSIALIVLPSKFTDGELEVFGYQLKTVLSGSMEPGIKTGSIISIQPITESERNNLAEGDVITFIENDNTLITHRITETNKTNSGVLYTTKGDNNNAEDREPVLGENVVGVYTGFTVPLVGYLVNFVQSPNGIILFLMLPGLLMLSYSAFNIWRLLGKVETKTTPTSVD